MSVIFIQSVFALAWLVTKKVVFILWGDDREAFEAIKSEYYWFEYMLLFVATVATPKHTFNEGLITIVAVIIIKFIFDRLTFVDDHLHRFFSKRKK